MHTFIFQKLLKYSTKKLCFGFTTGEIIKMKGFPFLHLTHNDIYKYVLHQFMHTLSFIKEVICILSLITYWNPTY